MPTILWTKKNFRNEIVQKLGEGFHNEFLDVITIHTKKVKPFDLKNHSLIFTSINGVHSFFENKFRPQENMAHLSHFNKIYAVGNRTKKELRKYGFGTFKMKKNAAELADFILKNSQDERFLHFCGNLALDILDEKLPLQNIEYKKITVYETHLLYPESCPNYDAVCFFSPSGVRSFVKHNPLDNKVIFSIGQTTENELKKHTHQPIITSKESSTEDLIEMIKSYYNPARYESL